METSISILQFQLLQPLELEHKLEKQLTGFPKILIDIIQSDLALWPLATYAKPCLGIKATLFLLRLSFLE